jgi:predicted DNA-binding antitoxin AbrB/MazE fold protein
MAMAILAMSVSAFAAEKTAPQQETNKAEKTVNPIQDTQDGKVVSITGDKLVMTDTQGNKECTCTVADDAKVTCDGKTCKVSDLKSGTKIRVTTTGTDKKVANRIEGIEKNSAFASKCHVGKVVSFTGDKLVMLDKDGKEHSHTLCPEAKLTLDGKTCKASDLKPGTQIRVTTPAADKCVANRIEGIEKNSAFASKYHYGKVVSIIENQLLMTNKDGKEHSHTLSDDVKLTLDGKSCKTADLKPGTRIRVTATEIENNLTNRIEGIALNSDFENECQEGNVVSVKGDKLVMTETLGGEESTCTLTPDVKVTCDGKVCKSLDLEPGMRIRVTLDNNEPQVAIKVEAIDKNPEFAGRYTELK